MSVTLGFFLPQWEEPSEGLEFGVRLMPAPDLTLTPREGDGVSSFYVCLEVRN